MKYTYDKDNSCLEVNLDEELDVSSCRGLKEVIDGYILRYEPKEFVMDLTNVKFMDSSGIGLLIGRYELIKMFNTQMTVLNATNSIKRVLELSHLNKKIEIRSR